MGTQEGEKQVCGPFSQGHNGAAASEPTHSTAGQTQGQNPVQLPLTGSPHLNHIICQMGPISPTSQGGQDETRRRRYSVHNRLSLLVVLSELTFKLENGLSICSRSDPRAPFLPCCEQGTGPKALRGLTHNNNDVREHVRPSGLTLGGGVVSGLVSTTSLNPLENAVSRGLLLSPFR